ncbi:thiamine phosphate synthase [Sphingomonas sp. TX0543]|uniref:thiamine phosphate synthase n=1 Tax=unclassified Sphingomonas TaxID=196159 RepID=UPI0010F4E505|nr:thiamine phosphate synthase [Sphingomonas sp. 3P27F8]
MRYRHPVPRLWLMTDERMGAGLWRAVRRLPRGSGIVFRHYATPARERRRLFAALLRISRRRGLVLVRAGDTRLAGEMGTHKRRGGGIVTWPAHSREQAVRAMRVGADAVFISPVFPTRSHPGAPALGARRASAIARGLPATRIALGGMDARSYARLAGFDGWAGIDGWL